MLRKLFAVSAFLFLFPIADHGFCGSYNGELSKSPEENSCEVKSSKMSFSFADNGQANGGKLEFSGICGGRGIEAALPVVDGMESMKDFTIIGEGAGKIDGGENFVRIIVSGSRRDKKPQAEATIFFDGQSYIAGDLK